MAETIERVPTVTDDLRRKRQAASKYSNYFHRAIRVRDMEATRHFYEDIVGLPLVGADAFTTDHATGEPCDYIHTFFALGDGSYLAFFQFADDKYPYYQRTGSYMDHHALTAKSKQVVDELIARVKAEGIFHVVVDDPVCFSVYVRDPDGDMFEAAFPLPGCADALEQADARNLLTDWVAKHGDKQVVVPRPKRS